MDQVELMLKHPEERKKFFQVCPEWRGIGLEVDVWLEM